MVIETSFARKNREHASSLTLRGCDDQQAAMLQVCAANPVTVGWSLGSNWGPKLGLFEPISGVSLV
jgi:hypothetical protein